MQSLSSPNTSNRRSHLLLICLALLTLAGCGGGGSQPSGPQNQLKGVFAVGRAVEGIITLVGANGKTTQAISTPEGNFIVDLSDLSYPLSLRGQSLDGSVTLYSYTNDSRFVNINQLTNHIVTNSGSFQPEQIFTATGGQSALIPQEALDQIETDLQNNLVVQIASSGIDKTQLEIFSHPVIANGIGYDALLDRVSDPANIDYPTDQSLMDAEKLQRVLAKFFIVNENGTLVPNNRLITRRVMKGFFDEMTDELVVSGALREVPFSSPSAGKLYFIDSSKRAVTSTIFNVARTHIVEIFGDIVGLNEADRLFIQETTSLFAQANFLNALTILYKGVRGEETGELSDRLVDAMEASFLGEARRFDTAGRVHAFFSDSLLDHFNCAFNSTDGVLGDTGTEQVCHFRDYDLQEEETVALFDGDVVSVSGTTSPFGLTGITPEPGALSSSWRKDSRKIDLQFSSDIHRGADDIITGQRALEVTLQNSLTGASRTCQTIEFQSNRRISCVVDSDFVTLNSEYLVTVSASSSNQTFPSWTVVGAIRYTTEDWLSTAPQISPNSGNFNDIVFAKPTDSSRYSLRYNRNGLTPTEENSERLLNEESVPIGSSQFMAFAFFNGSERVSPVTRRHYKINADERSVTVNSVVPERIPLGKPVELIINGTDLDGLSLQDSSSSCSVEESNARQHRYQCTFRSIPDDLSLHENETGSSLQLLETWTSVVFPTVKSVERSIGGTENELSLRYSISIEDGFLNKYSVIIFADSFDEAITCAIESTSETLLVARCQVPNPYPAHSLQISFDPEFDGVDTMLLYEGRQQAAQIEQVEVPMPIDMQNEAPVTADSIAADIVQIEPLSAVGNEPTRFTFEGTALNLISTVVLGSSSCQLQDASQGNRIRTVECTANTFGSVVLLARDAEGRQINGGNRTIAVSRPALPILTVSDVQPRETPQGQLVRFTLIGNGFSANTRVTLAGETCEHESQAQNERLDVLCQPSQIGLQTFSVEDFRADVQITNDLSVTISAPIVTGTDLQPYGNAHSAITGNYLSEAQVYFPDGRLEKTFLYEFDANSRTFKKGQIDPAGTYTPNSVIHFDERGYLIKEVFEPYIHRTTVSTTSFQAIEREQYWIERYQYADDGYIKARQAKLYRFDNDELLLTYEHTYVYDQNNVLIQRDVYLQNPDGSSDLAFRHQYAYTEDGALRTVTVGDFRGQYESISGQDYSSAANGLIATKKSWYLQDELVTSNTGTRLEPGERIDTRLVTINWSGMRDVAETSFRYERWGGENPSRDYRYIYKPSPIAAPSLLTWSYIVRSQ